MLNEIERFINWINQNVLTCSFHDIQIARVLFSLHIRIEIASQQFLSIFSSDMGRGDIFEPKKNMKNPT